MMMGLPIVKRRKRLRSRGRCHGIRPSRPIAPARSMAAIAETRIQVSSDRHLTLERRVRAVVVERELLRAEGIKGGDARVELQARQRKRLALELPCDDAEVVLVNVGIAEGMNER